MIMGALVMIKKRTDNYFIKTHGSQYEIQRIALSETAHLLRRLQST